MSLHTSPHDVEAQPFAHTPSGDLHLKYTLTHRHLFYLLVPHAFGAALIDAVANFAIACAMYRTTHKQIRLWPLDKNTIAGDMGVTVIIQGILTTLITGALVRADVRAGLVDPFPPLSFRWQRKLGRWRHHAGEAVTFLTTTHTLSLRTGRREFSKSLFLTLLRGFLLSALYFCLLWPLAIAITAPLYGGINMQGTWTPEIIKAIFGGVYGLFMNPVVAALALCTPPSRSPRPNDTPPAKRCIASTTYVVPPEVREVVAPLPLPPPPYVPPASA